MRIRTLGLSVPTRKGQGAGQHTESALLRAGAVSRTMRFLKVVATQQLLGPKDKLGTGDAGRS